MHLSYLPDELIAHIASCLNYSDVYNLMQTSKKNYNAIKKYKIDKIRLQTLQFGYSLSEKFTLEAIDSSGKKYSYKNWDETKVDANEVEKVLSKCASIDSLSVYLPNIFEIEFFNIIMDAKTCIRTIEIDCERTNISVDKLLMLCQKSIVHFIFRDDVDDAMLNDEVLLKIFPGSIRKSCSRIAGNVVSPMPIINRILQSLLCKTELPKRFRLDHVHNFITVNEVVKTINILHERSIDTGIYWDLGILQPSQAADAARYFGINGEMKGTCYVSKNGGNSYYTLLDSKFAKIFNQTNNFESIEMVVQNNFAQTKTAMTNYLKNVNCKRIVKNYELIRLAKSSPNVANFIRGALNENKQKYVILKAIFG